MTANNRVSSCVVYNKADFKRNLGRAEARNPCRWVFYSYEFKKEDIPLISQMRCQCLELWTTKHNDSLNDQVPGEEVMPALLALKQVKQLIIYNSLLDASGLYWFLYRTPISQHLTRVTFCLPQEFDYSLVKGLEYASTIVSLSLSIFGGGNIKYIHRYFSSTSLKRFAFQSACDKECIALMKEKRGTSLVSITAWHPGVQSSSFVSKYVSGEVLRVPTIAHAVNIFSTTSYTSLSEYQSYLFKEAGIKPAWS